MEKIRLDIVGLSTGQAQGTYTLILEEDSGNRKLPIIIGSFEAQAIAVEIEKIVPNRPMTHDLFVTFCKTFQVEVIETMIYSLVEGIFHSHIICKQEGKIYNIETRTSDAIALAVRFHCPVYTTPEIMRDASIILTDEEEESVAPKPGRPQNPHTVSERKDDFTLMSPAELEAELDKALRIEDYGRAAAIRDEMNRRK